MVAFAFAILYLLLAVGVIAVGKAYEAIPLHELKRRAAAGNRQASQLYRVAAYGNELTLLFVCAAAVSAAAGFVLFARVAPPVIGFIAVVLTLLLAYTWLPRKRQGKLGMQAAVSVAPGVAGLLRFLHPLLKRLVPLAVHRRKPVHTGLFDKEDVYELVERQKGQADSRLTETELDRMRRVLELGGAHVRDVLVPRRQVKMVDAIDKLSPVLLDELYGSSHAFFPVYEGERTNIVGILSLDAVADIKRQGNIGDYCSPRVIFIHEADSLESCLWVLAESRQHMLVVINSLGEYVGVVTLSDITRWLLGASERHSAHDDRNTVAARHRPPASVPSEKVVQ